MNGCTIVTHMIMKKPDIKPNLSAEGCEEV